jgi:hypothetical protein
MERKGIGVKLSGPMAGCMIGPKNLANCMGFDFKWLSPRFARCAIFFYEDATDV